MYITLMTIAAYICLSNKCNFVLKCQMYNYNHMSAVTFKSVALS